MPLKLKFKKLIFLLLAFVVNLLYKPSEYTRQNPDRVLYLQISRSPYKRYLYLLIKFFHLEGYQIYLTDNILLHSDLHKNKYARLLFKEKIIHIGAPPADVAVLHLDEQLLSPDYFVYKRDPKMLHGHYFIPFTQHPLMYHHGYWDKEMEVMPRKRTVFMAGNFDVSYRLIEKEGVFETLYSRLTVRDLVSRTARFLQIKGADALQAFLAGDMDQRVIMVDTADYEIPMEQFRPVLARFDFFLALPGVHMPLCHNLVEAMSVGAIPFIQESYAAHVLPALVDGETCITFRDRSDLEAKLEFALTLSDDKTTAMRANVNAYYQSHFTPSSQVRRIEKMNFGQLYLQSEAHSVALVKGRKD